MTNIEFFALGTGQIAKLLLKGLVGGGDLIIETPRANRSEK